MWPSTVVNIWKAHFILSVSIFKILCDNDTMTVLFLTVVSPGGAVHPVHISWHVIVCPVTHSERKFWAAGEQWICVLPSLREGYSRSVPPYHWNLLTSPLWKSHFQYFLCLSALKRVPLWIYWVHWVSVCQHLTYHVLSWLLWSLISRTSCIVPQGSNDLTFVSMRRVSIMET